MMTTTIALKNQFNSSLHMTEILVGICPESIWADSFHGVPFWQQVYHFVHYIDFWMRDDYSKEDFRCMAFPDNITTDLYAPSYAGLFISKQDMLEYIRLIQQKTDRLFDTLTDKNLAAPVPTEAFPFIEDPTVYTFMDVITGQIRHIMYNVGYLNGILRSKGLPESDWYSYNEPEGA